ncbi:MAG: hypothetical protein RIR18_2420 [Pseudomonadota bacterium]|jgi:hypothetical protein
MSNQEQPKRGQGRPGTYASAAARARAWRQRQKDLIAQAQQPAKPVVIEKIVEKVVDRIIEKPALPQKARGKSPISPDASKLIPLLHQKFGAYGGEDSAKRLRANAARAASTARDILGMFATYEPVPEAEKTFLEQAARFFDGLNAGFEVAQRSAKKAKAKADAEFFAKREAKIAEVIRLTFGETLDLAQVRAMAEAMKAYARRESNAIEAKRRGVDRAYFFISREYELRAALKNNDAQKIAREVAEVRLEAGEHGRNWKDQEETCYSAGWADFIKFRTNEM